MGTVGTVGERECRRRTNVEKTRYSTTGKKSLGVSDLIDKDTRAQGRRMTLEANG